MIKNVHQVMSKTLYKYQKIVVVKLRYCYVGDDLNVCTPAPASGKIMQPRFSQTTVCDWLMRGHCHAQICDWSFPWHHKHCLMRADKKVGGPEMRAFSVTWRSLKGRDICFTCSKNSSNSIVNPQIIELISNLGQV